MRLSRDQAIMFGRDLFGEPKKRASSDLRHNGTSFHGYVERGGVRLIDIRAELTTDLGPATVQGANFNIKATPASNGIGCEDDPCLTLAEFDNALRVRKEGKGALLLGSSVHDQGIRSVSLPPAGRLERARHGKSADVRRTRGAKAGPCWIAMLAKRPHNGMIFGGSFPRRRTKAGIQSAALGITPEPGSPLPRDER
jgi:acetoacetate decarboxylase